MSDPPGQLVVRPATVQDAGEIARIYNRHVDAGGATFDTEHWSTGQVVAMLSDGAPRDGWYLALFGDRVAGWAAARRYSARFGYRFTCESAIYLDPPMIGRGVADPLQRRIERHCREQDIHHAVARIVTHNSRSIAFHQRYGYECVGVQKEIGHMDGDWVDVTIMQKLFA